MIYWNAVLPKFRLLEIVTWEMLIRAKLRTVVAWIDFVIGFFVLSFGTFLTVLGRDEIVGSVRDQIVGILLMFSGLMLFLSASRITRGHNPRFRPFVYLLIAAALGVGAFLDQCAAKSPPVSRRDILGWALLMIVVIACILLQRALNGSRGVGAQAEFS